MTIIVNINGQDVPVDDAFKDLTPEQQEMEKAHIAEQLASGVSFGGGPAKELKEPTTVMGLPVALAPEAGAAMGATMGAAFGPATGEILDKGAAQAANAVRPMPGNASPNAPQSVRNWLATQTSTPYAGGRDYEEAKVKADIAGSKPVQSLGSKKPIRRGGLGINVQPPAETLPQKAAANLLNAERMPKPGITRRITGMGVAGAELGNMAKEFDEGNYGRAALSGVGALGGVASQSRIKPVRALGTALSVGVPAIQKFLLKDEDESNIQEKAAGGSVTSPKLKSLSDFLDQLMQQSSAPTAAPAPAAPQGMPQQGGIPLSPEQQAASLVKGQQAPAMGNLPGAPAPAPAPSPMPQMAGGGKVGALGSLAKKGLELSKKSNKATPGLDLGNVLPGATFRASPEQTVTNPLRNAFPGIYKRPDVIAQEAAARVAPESPALKQLFGVTRDDLYEMGKGRVGNMPGVLPGAAANPKGSRAALDVMNPRNEQRLLDVLSESEKYPELVRGMDPWYIMDPAYRRLEELVGPEEAIKKYRQLNTLTGMASPGSDVLTEMNRGTAANYLATQGRFGDFVDYAGKPMGARGADFPEDLRAVMGHPYHRTAQAIPMQQYLDTGAVQMSSPKVPAYIQASSVPEAGFQTDLPVGDAHWSRAVGLADTRGAATRKGQSVIPGASVSNPEMSALAPWWKDKIAAQVGLESVPAQARAWGAFSPQTGVESPIGAPKLELLSMKIMEAANRYGVSPEQARDMILKGEGYAGKKEGGLV